MLLDELRVRHDIRLDRKLSFQIGKAFKDGCIRILDCCLLIRQVIDARKKGGVLAAVHLKKRQSAGIDERKLWHDLRNGYC